MADFHTKYRPETLEQVIGQDAVTKALASTLEKRSCHAFIFVGPSGTGKTTLARIVANMVGCSPTNYVEVDAATFTGVDSMRALTESISYVGLGSKTKVMCIDEAHALSSAAWQSLLKKVEEPPKHVYWIFSTTEPSKIPETIKTRCQTYQLQPVGADEIFELIRGVAEAEGLKIDEGILDLVSKNADGSPRRALTCLSQVAAATNRKEAAEIINTVGDEAAGDLGALIKSIMKGVNDWPTLMQSVAALKGQKGESIRIVIVDYFTKVALGAKTNDAAARALTILSAFSDPYPAGAGLGPLLISLGRISLS